MRGILNGLIIFAAILTVVSIILQNKGVSLGAGFGGDSNAYRSKRGAEKVLFYATIVSASFMFAFVLATLFIKY